MGDLDFRFDFLSFLSFFNFDLLNFEFELSPPPKKVYPNNSSVDVLGNGIGVGALYGGPYGCVLRKLLCCALLPAPAALGRMIGK